MPPTLSGLLFISVFWALSNTVFAPHVYTFPSSSRAIAIFSPASICFMFFRSSPFSVFTWIGSFLFSVSFIFPSCPSSFVPHVHTVPFSFNATTKSFPAFTCASLCPSSVTFTVMYVLYPLSSSVIFIFVSPFPTATIFPVSSTSAIVPSSVSYFRFPIIKSSVCISFNFTYHNLLLSIWYSSSVFIFIVFFA